MKAFLLVATYLARDILNRWKMRVSAPLSRFLVVFCLSSGALAILVYYRSLIDNLEERIRLRGGNIMLLTEVIQPGSSARSPKSLIDTSGACETFIFDRLNITIYLEREPFPVFEYGCSGYLFLSEWQPDIHNNLYVLARKNVDVSYLGLLRYGHLFLRAYIAHNQNAQQLRSLFSHGAVFVPSGRWKRLKSSLGFTRYYFYRFSSQAFQRVRNFERYIREIARLDNRQTEIHSNTGMMEQLASIRNEQARFRTGVCLSVGLIIGVMSIAISSLQFKENEYVYALLGSFGACRVLLVFFFFLENTVLTSCGVGLSLIIFGCAGKEWPADLLVSCTQSGFWESMRLDIALLCFSLLASVVLSTLPVLCSTFRPIGKILK